MSHRLREAQVLPLNSHCYNVLPAAPLVNGAVNALKRAKWVALVNHPNRNWRRRWTVDVPAREARHENGLVVRFTRDSQGWLGDAVAGVDTVNPLDAATLMRQAGEVFEKAVAKTNA